jgi:hypothetical protein
MSSKAGTMYTEYERLTKLKQLETYGLNPFAVFGLFESYVKNVAPLPIKYVYYMTRKDKLDQVVESKGMVELYIATAGYSGNKQGDISKISNIHANLFCRSYYQNMRPMAVSFQMANSVEIHLRTPGVSDSDSIAFNPFKDFFDPTAEKKKPKKKR